MLGLAVGVKTLDSASPPTSAISLPMPVPLLQFCGELVGPQTKKSTVPVATPLLPLTTTVSVTDSPELIVTMPEPWPWSFLTWVAMSGVAHSGKDP